MKGIGGREAGWSGGGGSGHKGIFYERHGEVEVEMIMVRRKAARWGKPPRTPPARARTRRVPLSSSTTSNGLLDLENVSLEGTRPHHLSPITLHQLSSARFWSTACLDPTFAMFTPRHPQPFTLREAIGLDVSTITAGRTIILVSGSMKEKANVVSSSAIHVLHVHIASRPFHSPRDRPAAELARPPASKQHRFTPVSRVRGGRSGDQAERGGE